MENFEQKTLIHELSQGKELAKKLMSHLHPSSSQETRDLLLEQILSSYEKVLSMLNHTKNMKESNSLESTHSLGHTTSPRSVISDQQSTPRDVFKKRKTMPRWTEQVKVCLGTGPEGPLDDGYNWRKYGQKDILGANHPRGYYRCTHRNSQGCLATKQVQKSDEDPSLFEVTYRGRHTCSRSSQLSNIASNPQSQVKQEKTVHNFPQQQEEKNQTQSQSALLNLKAGLGVKTEDLDTREDSMIFPPFSFPPTPIEPDTVDTPFLPDAAIVEGSLVCGFSPRFLSPATSDSNYFAASPWHDFGTFGQCNSSESDHAEILSAPTSVTNSPIGDLDLTIDKLDFELSFPFDSPEFFA